MWAPSEFVVSRSSTNRKHHTENFKVKQLEAPVGPQVLRKYNLSQAPLGFHGVITSHFPMFPFILLFLL